MCVTTGPEWAEMLYKHIPPVQQIIGRRYENAQIDHYVVTAFREGIIKENSNAERRASMSYIDSF